MPALKRLAQLLAEGNAGKLQALRDFSINNPDLQRLEELLAEAKAQPAEFDLFEVIRPKLWEYEDVHSNVLAWLLDPRANHGFGDCFLKHFVLAAGPPSGIEIAGDWSEAKSQQEWPNVVDGQWGYLDILLVNDKERFLCAIENKVSSSEHSEQLTRYRKALEERYPDYDRHCVFLSPRGMLPYREEEQEHWTAVSYKAVLQSVEQAILNNVNPIKEDVRVFLQQYANTLRRNIVPDTNTNIAALARQIYLEHREAIELIIKYKPDFEEDAKQFFREAIDLRQAWIRDAESPKLVRFRSTQWDQFRAFKTGTGWPQSHSIITFEVDFRPGHPHLILTLGPSADEGIRQKVHERVLQHPEIFKGTNQSLTRTWTRLSNLGYELERSYLDNWDAEAVQAKVMEWMSNFAENQFPAMNEVIVNCLRDYEAEQDQ